MLKQVLVAVLVGGALFSPSLAHAQNWPTTDPNFAGPQLGTVPTAEKFGQVGQVVIASDFQADFSYSSQKPAAGASSSTTQVRLVPAVDYFIARNLAVGGALGVTFTNIKPTDISVRTFEVGPEVGYSVLIGPRVTLFPKVGIRYRNVDLQLPSQLVGTASQTEHHLGLKLAVPLLVHPFEHIFLGAGPILSFDVLSRSAGQAGAKETDIALSFIVGGWF